MHFYGHNELEINTSIRHTLDFIKIPVLDYLHVYNHYQPSTSKAQWPLQCNDRICTNLSNIFVHAVISRICNGTWKWILDQDIRRTQSFNLSLCIENLLINGLIIYPSEKKSYSYISPPTSSHQAINKISD